MKEKVISLDIEREKDKIYFVKFNNNKIEVWKSDLTRGGRPRKNGELQKSQ